MEIDKETVAGEWETEPQGEKNEKWTVTPTLSVEECMKYLFPEKTEVPKNIQDGSKRARTEE